jgi:nucleoid-associated protein EbfC
MRNPLQSLMEGQFAQMSQKIGVALQELAATEVEGSAGGGAVKVRLTGGADVLGVEISEAAVQPGDLELLQDLVCAAMRDAMGKVLQLRKDKLAQATPLGALGIDLPDML